MRSVEQSFEEWLNDVLGKVKGEKLDIAAAVYKEIQSEKDSVRAFQYFLQNADDIISTEEQEIPPRYTAAETQKLKNNYASCVMGILNSALNKNCSEDAFYELLWNSKRLISLYVPHWNRKSYLKYLPQCRRKY